MKRVFLSFAAAIACMATFAQESEATSPFSISADVVSRYVWRGLELSTSPSIQPGASYSIGGLTAGTWANYSFNNLNSDTEFDLYMSYDFEFGLGLVVNDYFFPDLTKTNNYANNLYSGYFDKDEHTFEAGITYGIQGFSIGAYKYLNQDKDLYIEAGYEFKNAKIFVGAGDKNYTTTGNINICNVGLSLSKEVSITDTWKVAPYASIVVNPNKEIATLVLGITL